MPTSFSDEFFTITEAREFDAELALSVLQGSRACVVFRGFSPADHCRRIFDRFRSCAATRVREGDATGLYLGSFHWLKVLDEYFDDAERVSLAIAETLNDGSEPGWSSFVDSLGSHLSSRGCLIRKAKWKNREASSPIIRAWNRIGDYSLVPHEDFAQCRDPNQSNFEIQKIAATLVSSANLCIENGRSGELVLWNCVPNDEERIALGTQVLGGPYPLNFVEQAERLDVRVNVGDLYIFNGSLIHAVAATSEMRATISSLLGYVDAKTVVMWS